MADDSGDAEDRTEAATPRRLQRAREEGNAPLSRELAGFAVLGVAAMLLVMVAPGLVRELASRMAVLLAQAHAIDPVVALHAAARTALMVAAPFALASLLAAAGSELLQSGFLVNLKALQPDLGRLSPMAGLKRVFGVATLVETGKAVLKALATAVLLTNVLSGALPDLAGAMFWTVPGLMDHLSRLLLQLVLAALAVQGAVALLDVLRVRMKFAVDMRMSRQDIRQEMRESDGDPLVKGRLRQLRQQRARKRMMAAVPKATVVVTNPTHYAIALVYDRATGGAPRVVAKGVDAVAARIRSVAEENKVPLVANPPLARALFTVELDAEIPAEHFQAVAEIIAYVWRLRGSARGARR